MSGLPRLIVVSLHKAGTHLARRLIEEIGYHREELDDDVIRSALHDKAEVFLPRLKADAAYFIHECRVDRFPRKILEHWRETGDPAFIYQYRDPRAVLLSQVNYLRRAHTGRTFSNTPYHLVFSDVLLAQADERRALDVAIDCMGDYLVDSFLGSVWMLHHPGVLQLRFEDLVGARGNGSDEAQREAVARTLAHLRRSGDLAQIGAGLFDSTERTFHRGTADGFRAVYTHEQLERFEIRYGHLLDVFGYERFATPRGGRADQP